MLRELVRESVRDSAGSNKRVAESHSVRKGPRRTDKHLEAVEVSEEAVATVNLADEPHDQLLVDL